MCVSAGRALPLDGRSFSVPLVVVLRGRVSADLQGGYLVSRSGCIPCVGSFVVSFGCVQRLPRECFIRCYFVSFVSVSICSFLAISRCVRCVSL